MLDSKREWQSLCAGGIKTVGVLELKEMVTKGENV